MATLSIEVRSKMIWNKENHRYEMYLIAGSQNSLIGYSIGKEVEDHILCARTLEGIAISKGIEVEWYGESEPGEMARRSNH